MRPFKTGSVFFFTLSAVLASCAPAPIIRAVRSGDEDQIQQHLNQGNDVNGFYHASDLRWCWIPVIGFLGDPGIIMCPVLQSSDQSTPLMTAIGDGNFKTARFLVAHGADVNLPAKYDQPHMGPQPPVLLCPLTVAIEAVDSRYGARSLQLNSRASLEESAKFVKFLVAHGADVNACAVSGKGAFYNILPLFAAAEIGNEAAAKTLLDHGANIEEKDLIWGGTPLMWAAWRGHAKMVQFLLQRGANVHAIAERSDDRTVLDWADCPSSPHNPEVIRLITAALRNNAPAQVASINSSRDSAGSDSSPSGEIFKAARNGDDDRVQTLLQRGVDVNSTDSYGFTPLMWAAYEGQTDTAEILIKAGAHLTMTNRDGDNALMIAADKGHLDMVKLLFRHGAPLNDRDEKGYTAMAWAEKRRHRNVVEFLKGRGARAVRVKRRDESKPKKRAEPDLKKEKTPSEAPAPEPEEHADVQSILP